jgi:hypothetical protein
MNQRILNPTFRQVRPMANNVLPFRNVPSQRGLLGQNVALKRPFRGGFISAQQSAKLPRLYNHPPQPPARPANSLLCRLCAQLSSTCFPIKDRPEVVESVRFVFGVDLDLEEDLKNGYPEFVCRKCINILSTISGYKKVFETAQLKLKMAKEKKDRELELREEQALAAREEIVTSETVKVSTEIVTEDKLFQDSILPGWDYHYLSFFIALFLVAYVFLTCLCKNVKVISST